MEGDIRMFTTATYMLLISCNSIDTGNGPIPTGGIGGKQDGGLQNWPGNRVKVYYQK